MARAQSQAAALAAATLALEEATAKLAALDSLAGVWQDSAAALRGHAAGDGAAAAYTARADTLCDCARQVKAAVAGGEVGHGPV